MATVRTNPLPRGVFWLDLFRPMGSASTVPDQQLDFIAWEQASGPAVKVLKREPGNLLRGETPQRDRIHVWYLFEVTGTPAAFPFQKLGFPTVQKLAKDGITEHDRKLKADDTVQKPEPEGLKDSISALFASDTVRAVLLLLVAAAFMKQKNR